MNRARRRWCLAGLLAAGLTVTAAVIVGGLAQPGQSPEAQLDATRVRVMAPERVAQLVIPQPGGVVLDIGAGFGLYTFPLGQATGDAGRVYATDVDPSAIHYLAQEVEQRGVANVVPVRVRSSGLDPFYRQHAFDVILVADLLPTLATPHVFFDRLRPSLKKGTGRLWVINPRADPDFDALEFGDFAALRDLAQAEGARSPIVSRLRAEVREGLASDQLASVPEPLWPQIIEDLNTLLEDPGLWPAVQERVEVGKSYFGPRWQQLGEFLARDLQTQGIFNSSQSTLSDSARQSLRLLNRAIIQEALHTDEWHKVFGLEGMSGDQRKRGFLKLRSSPPLGIFSEVGYELVEEHKALVYHHVWEFRRAR